MTASRTSAQTPFGRLPSPQCCAHRPSTDPPAEGPRADDALISLGTQAPASGGRLWTTCRNAGRLGSESAERPAPSAAQVSPLPLVLIGQRRGRAWLGENERC